LAWTGAAWTLVDAARAALVGRFVPTVLLAHPGHQRLLAHDLRDGLLADPPARLAQVVGDPR
jgi:hypothetical protein